MRTATLAPPMWWPRLLSAVAARDREHLAVFGAEYTRDPVPGEWWPGRTPDNSVVVVSWTPDGPLRRLVVRE